MAHPQLSAGAIVRAENNDTSGQPTVQIVDLKHINNPQGGRYRLLVSDGTQCMQAMLATQNNNLVESGSVRAAPRLPTRAGLLDSMLAFLLPSSHATPAYRRARRCATSR